MLTRIGTEKDKNIAREIWEECFKDTKTEIDFYFDKIFKPENLIVVENDKGEVKACIHKNKYEIKSKPSQIDARFLVAAGVKMDSRNQGYLDAVMKGVLKSRHDIVYLHPVNPEIYTKYGCGYISRLEEYSGRLSDIEFKKINPKFRMSSEIDYEKICKLYNENYMEDINFCTYRDEKTLKRLVSEVETDGGYVMTVKEGNNFCGYVIFYKNDDDIIVREMYGLSYEVSESILAFLRGFKDYYENIKITMPYGSNLDLLFRNPTLLKKEIKPYMFGRILNLENILKKFVYAKEKINIKVKDNMIEKNNKTFKLIHGKVSKTNEDFDVEIDINTLTSLIFGYATMDDYIKIGSIKYRDEFKTYLKKGGLKFSGGPVYLNDYQ